MHSWIIWILIFRPPGKKTKEQVTLEKYADCGLLKLDNTRGFPEIPEAHVDLGFKEYLDERDKQTLAQKFISNYFQLTEPEDDNEQLWYYHFPRNTLLFTVRRRVKEDSYYRFGTIYRQLPKADQIRIIYSKETEENIDLEEIERELEFIEKYFKSK